MMGIALGRKECECGRYICEGHTEHTTCCGAENCAECDQPYGDFDNVVICKGECELQFMNQSANLLHFLGWKYKDLQRITSMSIKSIEQAKRARNRIDRWIEKKEGKRTEEKPDEGSEKESTEEQEEEAKCRLCPHPSSASCIVCCEGYCSDHSWKCEACESEFCIDCDYGKENRKYYQLCMRCKEVGAKGNELKKPGEKAKGCKRKRENPTEDGKVSERKKRRLK